MFLSIMQREQTAEELVGELVRECSVGEQLRLLAWANMPRLEEIEQETRKRNNGGGDGPDSEGERVATNAVAAGRL
jgi:hypothetical protein